MKIFRWMLCLLCCTVSLSSCQINGGHDPLANLREAGTVTVSGEDQLFTLELTETGGIFRFSSPELLQNLTVTYDGKAFHAVYGTLETTVSQAFLGEVFPLYEAIRAFQTCDAVRESENILSVSLDGITFLLYYDSESDLITRLETKGADGTKGYDVLSCIKKDDNAESSRTDSIE